MFAFLKRALGDEHEVVAQGMVEAGREIIEKQVEKDTALDMHIPPSPFQQVGKAPSFLDKAQPALSVSNRSR